ncbi:MAG: hypothetical protein ACE5G0_09555 [Rhodothermales bacterium]
MTHLPTEFREFLKLLNEHEVRYLLIGGYAVGYYGYPRATADIDVWIACEPENAERMVAALTAFGFGVEELEPALFLDENRIIRMGYAPLRIEIMMSISGVEFEACYGARRDVVLDGIEVSVIGLACLKQNKRTSGRYRDLDDLEHLP